VKIVLYVVVFIGGAVVMVLELVATRIIAPYLGASSIVWTSLIGVILAGLSVGYFVGGKIADKKATYKGLALIFIIAGLLVILILYFKPILGLIAKIENLQAGALLASLILFTPATIALGTIAPYAVRLRIESLQNSGNIVGKLYALSTVGSIVGTFLGGFFLISYFGSTKILEYLSATLILSGVFVYVADTRKSTGLIALPLLPIILTAIIPPYGLILEKNAELLTDVDSEYSRLWVYDSRDKKTNRPARYLTTSVELTQSGMYLDNPEELLLDYAKLLDLAEMFNPKLNRGLLIGAGAYSYPKYFLKKYPEATLDAVEIDEKMTMLARQYFFLKDNPRLAIYHQDGRTFLSRIDNKYDAIFIDAFLSPLSIPYHLTTVEIIKMAESKLATEGVVIVNIIGALQGHRSDFFTAEYGTYKTVFPNVYVFRAQPERKPDELQNIILVAAKSNNTLVIDNKLRKSDYLKNWWPEKVTTNLPILTDDFAPVEKYVTKSMF